MFEIPTSIEFEDCEIAIRNKGDYRMVLDCFNILEDQELTKQERIAACLVVFYDGMEDLQDISTLPDLEVAVKEMFKFFNCGQLESPGTNAGYKLVDWEKDTQLIASAVNKVAGKEIRLEPYVHYWTFMGYYSAIGNSPFSNIVSIRNKMVKGKKLEKYEQEFKRENPHYFEWNRDTVAQKEAEEWVSQMWNSEA